MSYKYERWHSEKQWFQEHRRTAHRSPKMYWQRHPLIEPAIKARIRDFFSSLTENGMDPGPTINATVYYLANYYWRPSRLEKAWEDGSRAEHKPDKIWRSIAAALRKASKQLDVVRPLLDIRFGPTLVEPAGDWTSRKWKGEIPRLKTAGEDLAPIGRKLDRLADFLDGFIEDRKSGSLVLTTKSSRGIKMERSLNLALTCLFEIQKQWPHPSIGPRERLNKIILAAQLPVMPYAETIHSRLKKFKKSYPHLVKGILKEYIPPFYHPSQSGTH